MKNKLNKIAIILVVSGHSNAVVRLLLKKYNRPESKKNGKFRVEMK
jgi:hypothetical protein